MVTDVAEKTGFCASETVRETAAFPRSVPTKMRCAETDFTELNTYFSQHETSRRPIDYETNANNDSIVLCTAVDSLILAGQQ